MAVLTIKTFEDMINYVREHAQIADSIDNMSTEDLDAVKRLLNEGLDIFSFHKLWPWREKTRQLLTDAKQTTGTISVTDGSRLATFSAANTVTLAYKGQFIRIGSDPEWYEIIAVTDAANRQVALSTEYKGTTAATATYVMFRGKYGLWPDYADTVAITPMGPTGISSRTPLRKLTRDEYVNLVAESPFRESTYPEFFYIADFENYDGVDMGDEFIMGYDFMEADANDLPLTNKAIWFYPRIFNETMLEFKYGQQPEAMTSLKSVPQIPREKRMILPAYALKEWFLTRTQNMALADRYEIKYEKLLRKIAGDFDITDSNPQLTPTTRRRRPLIIDDDDHCSCPET